MLDSATWKVVDARPAISFHIEQRRPMVRHARLPRGPSIAMAEGRVEAAGEGCLEIRNDPDGAPREEEDAAVLSCILPEPVDLGRLLGLRVCVTLRTEPLAAGPVGQLLTIAAHDGGVLLVAHHGPAQGNTHAVGKLVVRASLSQRPGGPIVFGSDRLQCVLQVGEHMVIGGAEEEHVIQFVARTAAGYAAYIIVAKRLWTGAHAGRSSR